jgi:PKD repeat protein
MVLLAMGAGLLMTRESASAADRRFLVILANSPKQFPHPGAGTHEPPGGLESYPFSAVDRAYFNKVSPPDSFAEFWEEISYRDVTVSGRATDWIHLPWAFQPPLVSEGRDHPENGPPVDDDLTDITLRHSPMHFADLNNSTRYEYGVSEPFSNLVASGILDLDGNPGGRDNGPFAPGPGSMHVGAEGKNVWKPGERFVDIDGDGRWDGLDEANNLQDYDGDGFPDLLGPWYDLNGDNVGQAPSGCRYLPDSDNDGFPDCCPRGFDPDRPEECDCPTTRFDNGNGSASDCNGNLIPDVCDVNCVSPECLELGGPARYPECGSSRDELPFIEEEIEGQDVCIPGEPDGIPDECQFENWEEDCTEQVGGEGPCNNNVECRRLEQPQLTARCEYHDVNASRTLDVVEPFENFLRRWDPCYTDPDVSPPNADSVHWIKVYDPASSSSVTCLDPMKGFAYSADTTFQPELDENGNPNPLYVPSYIQMNYPGTGTDPNTDLPFYTTLEAQAQRRPVFGKHDPLGLLPAGECRCALTFDPETGTPNPPCGGPNLPPCDEFRPCFDYDANGDGEVTENEEGICFLGYHAVFNPSDSWTNTIVAAGEGPRGNMAILTTKVREAPGSNQRSAFVTATPRPGDSVSPFSRAPINERPWYEQAWRDRYDRIAGPNDISDPPPWPTGYDPNLPPPPGGTPGVKPNTPDIRPYDPAADGRRFFKANFGGTSVGPGGLRRGVGTGWPGEETAFVVFETGLTGVQSFEENRNGRILPEEVGGLALPPIMFDGFAEYDDLPSSKYHLAGDQRFGEVTSPWQWARPGFEPPIPANFGQDLGTHVFGRFSSPEGLIPAAGPYAVNVHGTMGRDAGNVMLMEYLTWRTDGTSPSYGAIWEEWYGTSHPYAGPGTPLMPNENLGFRDYNLDGLIDQGEVRYPFTENYLVDSYPSTRDWGVSTVYPFNRQRLVEDAVAVIDEVLDFDDFVDAVSMARVACPERALGYFVPTQLGGFDFGLANGIVSGIVLLTPYAGGFGPVAPGWYPIHNQDNDDPLDMWPKIFPQYTPKEHTISWNLLFHDFVYPLDGNTEGGYNNDEEEPQTDYGATLAAHEYGHAWEGWPDLYDVQAVWGNDPLENKPIGNFDLMATGGMVHPIPPLKEQACTEWIESTDLVSILTPGVTTTITVPPSEFNREKGYYFLENEKRIGERFYFYSVGLGFDVRMPGKDLLLIHTDIGSNPDALPPQQGTGTRFAYKVVQADGLDQMDAGVNSGDANDTWPGGLARTKFDFDTVPASLWYTQDAWSGMSISDIRPDGQGSVAVSLSWTPTNIPGFSFVNPPGGNSVRVPPDTIYQIRGRGTDVYGGTHLRYFYTDDPQNLTYERDGKNAARNRGYVGGAFKRTPGTHPVSQDWNIVDVPDGFYHVYADLIPGEGADGFEIAVTSPRASRNNQGNGTLKVDRVDNTRPLMDGEYEGVPCTLIFKDPDTSTDFTQDGIDRPVFGDLFYLKILQGQNVQKGDCALFPVVRVDAQRLAFLPGVDPRIGTQGPFKVTQYGIYTGRECQGGPCSLQYPNICFDLVPGTAGISGDILELGTFLTWDELNFETFGIMPGDQLMIKARNNRSPQLRTVVKLLGDTNIQNDLRVLELSAPMAFAGSTEIPVSEQWEIVRPGDSRFETWIAECVSADGKIWKINSTLTLPFPEDDDPEQDPHPHLILTGNPAKGTYRPQGLDLPVEFTITESSKAFAMGDRFTFTTTGLTAVSDGVQVLGGRISAGPIAIIDAAPLSGRAPLDVRFDGRSSYDPTGETLQYRWTFDDGSPPAQGGLVTHAFIKSGTYTVVLRVTNPRTQQFGEAFIDIEVINNSPKAVIVAAPTSGPTPLSVTFDGTNSSDPEDPVEQLLFEWDFGDGDRAGTGNRGELMIVEHFYTTDGLYTAMLTVTDTGGKKSFATTQVLVGNTRPVANIFHTGLQGPAPHKVTFNAINSRDADGDEIKVTWKWGDGTANETYGLKGPDGETGRVEHTFQNTGDYKVTAVLDDQRGGVTNWSGVTVKVSEPGDESSLPTAIFTIAPDPPVLNEEFEVDGALSFDRPASGRITRYLWDFGDGEEAEGVAATHTYTRAGTYTITLTVFDNDSPPNTSARSMTFELIGGDIEPPPPDGGVNRPPTAFLVANPETGLAGETEFTFDASASSDPEGGALRFLWNFGDGETASGATVRHVYTEPRAYTVRLIVRDDENASTTATAQVVVSGLSANNAPQAFITAGPRGGSVPLSLTFNGATSFDPDGDPLTFRWEITNLQTSEVVVRDGVQISYKFENPGNYAVELVVEDNRGAVGRSPVERVTVTARVENNNTNTNDNDEPGQDVPDSAGQRGRVCGLGMIPALFGSLIGLTATMAGRRRTRR